MQALECLFKNRLALRAAPEHVSRTCCSTRCGPSKNRNSTASLHSVLRKRTSLSSNSAWKFLPLHSTRTLCSMPVSRHMFDSKASLESESTSLEIPVQELTIKCGQARLHSAPILKCDHDFTHSDELTSENAEELVLDSIMRKLLLYSPFSCSGCSTDSFEVDLTKCADSSDVLEVVKANASNMSIENARMAVAKLWQITSSGFTNNLLDFQPPYSPLEISQSPVLSILLQVVENNFHQLDDDKISCLMVQLYCMGLTHNSFLVHKMLGHFMPHCDTLPLKILARILLFLRNPDMNYSVKGKLMPSLIKCLTDCKNKSDFILIDYCIESTWRLLPASISGIHCKKIVDLLDAGEISNEDTKILLRVLKSIMMAESRVVYQEVLARVCSMLVPKINCLEVDELINLSHHCSQHKLGRHLMNNLYRQVALAMEDATDPVTRANLFIHMCPERAQSLVPEMLPVVRCLVRSPSSKENAQKALLQMFRSRTIINRNLLDEYWDKMLRNLDETLSHPELFSYRIDAFVRETIVSQVLLRYLYFNTNLRGQYRHRRLEARIIKLLLVELSGVAGLVTKRLSRMSSFVLAFSDPAALPGGLVVRLLESFPQLQLEDVTSLTQGLQMSQSLNSSCTDKKYVSKLLILAHMLSASIQHLAAESTDLEDLTKLSRLSNSLDNIFAKYGSGHSSVMSKSTSLWSRGPLPSVFQTPTPSPPSLATSNNSSLMPPAQLQILFPPRESPLPPVSSHDHRTHVSSLWRKAFSVSDAKGSLTQARVAPFLAPSIHQMSHKTASTLAQIYARSNFYNVQVLDGILDYLYENRAEAHGLIVGQALDCAFSVGHAPNLSLEPLRALAAVLAEDLSSMHGLSLISSVLALSFYQSLPKSLIKKIFNVGFMDFLDKEFQNSFSKNLYPVWVREKLMELNRSVCIDCPEANVPWFHEEHCRDFIQTVCHKRDGFFTDVHRVLTKVLGSERLFSSRPYSPYYHLMDFSFVLNDKGKAVMQPDEPSALKPRLPETLTTLPPGYTRHCILLMNPFSFVMCQSISDTGVMSVQPQLKGPMLLKQRHLEVLGYDVVNIAKHDWQSMSLCTPASKEAYLTEKIFGSRP